MTPERWKQVEQLYNAALERPSEERDAFLENACAGDELLKREVESLLAQESRADQFLEVPAIEMMAEIIADDRTSPGAGRRIGPYEILSFIGAGGMGQVYLARDIRLGRKIAIKLLREEITRESENVRRFEREARAASALNHPNILTIYDVGHAGPNHYIATEFIEGQTLRKIIQSAKMDPDQILDVAIQVTGAISSAHQAGIIHRDIKPENIMVRADGLVKVLDFGLAKLAHPPNENGETAPIVSELRTKTGVIMGTALYMSPEQARGQIADGRSDVFSIGVVMYEMAAGKAPFASETEADIIASLLANEPLPLSEYRQDIPAPYSVIITKALKKKREQRYQSVDEMLADLKSLKAQSDFDKEIRRSGQNRTTARGASRTRKRPTRKMIDSIAILPLNSPSADPNMEYLSAGIAENLMNTLSRLPNLRVMAWSTVSRYRNREMDPREIGKELGVRTVLTTRTTRFGDRLIMKTELVDTTDGSYIWGGQHSLQASDLMGVESEIAREISEKLLLKLTGQEKKQLQKAQTDNVAAYHAYLKGRYYWNKRTDEEVRKATEYFKQAIDLDPCYALAYSGLADCYIILGAFGIATMRPADAYPKAREAASKALEIDDTLAEAHVSLAFTLSQYYWDWNAAEREFQRSFQLKPLYSIAHHWYGFHLIFVGRLNDGIAAIRRAHELEPLSLSISSDLGLFLYLARQYDQAVEECKKILEMDRNFPYAHWKLGLAYEQKQMYAEAVEEFERAAALYGRSALPALLLAHTYAASGNRQKAVELLDPLIARSTQTFVSPCRIAAVYAALDQTDTAFEWLSRAFVEHDAWLLWLQFDPVFDSLREDPRLIQLLKDIESPSSRISNAPTRPPTSSFDTRQTADDNQ